MSITSTTRKYVHEDLCKQSIAICRMSGVCQHCTSPTVHYYYYTSSRPESRAQPRDDHGHSQEQNYVIVPVSATRLSVGNREHGLKHHSSLGANHRVSRSGVWMELGTYARSETTHMRLLMNLT